MKRPQQRFLWFVGLVALATGCPQCAPDRVGTGVAQLTVRNVGMMVSLVNSNTECGFASPAVQQAAAIEGSVGSAGTLTMTVNSCVIDLGEAGRAFPADCNGVASTARGKVTISATRVVEGTLTGVPQTPIIPSSADAVTITITEAVVDDFEVRNLSSDNVLTMLDGSISAVAKPHLAVSESSGACSISLPNVTFSNITYDDATVHLETPDNSFDVPVPTSNLSAQNGAYAGAENELSGTITVFDSAVTISDDLDPNYDAARFASSYACTPDLEQPVSFQCADLRPRLADGAARLSAKMLGTVTSLIDSNNSCGFSAPAVLGAAQLTGTPGDTGSMTLTVSDCTLAFAEELVLPADCNGASTTVLGSVTVSGTKTVSGRFTGNPASPIVPLTEQPAEFALEITVNPEGFRVGSTADGNALRATAGTLTGTTQPRLFVGSATGVCSVSSPHVEFTIDWAGADLLVSSASGTLALNDVDTDLTAVNGSVGGATNTLAGTVTVAGDSFTVPSDETGLLNPDYDAAAFDAAWQCGATATALASPANSQCGAAVMRTVAGGTAALTMRTLGTVMRLVDANSSCGFSSVDVAGAPAVSGGTVGDDDVTATFTLPSEGCTITLPADFVISTDCQGNTSTAGGTVVVTGTKAVTGFLTGSSNPAEAIVPTSFKPATFDLTLTFDGFVVKSSTSTAWLTVHDGSLSGVVQPRTALNPTTGACSIGTPNLTFSDVVWSNANVTLTSSGSHFNAAVSTSNLAAQNGSDGTETNSLSGDITVDGAAIAGITAPLDAAYDQATFDATYVCAGNGNPVLVPDAACSFRQVLGNAAARLLAGSTAFATSAGASCFDATQTISGTIGQPGSATATASACEVTLPAGAVTNADCSGGSTTADGTVTLSGTRSTNPGLVIDGDSDGTADTIAPLSRTAVTYTSMTYEMAAWRFEKLISGNSAGRMTVTGTVGASTFTPVLAERDEDDNDVGDGVFTKRTPIFEFADLTMASGRAVLLLQGKTFGVDLTGVNLDVLVGAYSGRANAISGALTVDGEPVSIAPAFDAAFTQEALDATYSCDTQLILVPAN